MSIRLCTNTVSEFRIQLVDVDRVILVPFWLAVQDFGRSRRGRGARHPPLCAESKTVKRVIHTASVSAASPLTKSSADASAVYRDFISESCWTPLEVDYPLRNAHFDVSSSDLVLQTIMDS